MELATTIQIKKSLKEKLKELKEHPRESFESVIERLVDNFEDDEPLSAEEIKDIKKSLKEIEQGKVYPLHKVRKELGI